MKAHRRHDISDNMWRLLGLHWPGRFGSWGGIARNNCLFINAVFWIMRTGVPWRDLPLTMAVGAIRTVVLFAGETRASGKGRWTYSLMSQIMNG